MRRIVNHAFHYSQTPLQDDLTPVGPEQGPPESRLERERFPGRRLVRAPRVVVKNREVSNLEVLLCLCEPEYVMAPGVSKTLPGGDGEVALDWPAVLIHLRPSRYGNGRDGKAKGGE